MGRPRHPGGLGFLAALTALASASEHRPIAARAATRDSPDVDKHALGPAQAEVPRSRAGESLRPDGVFGGPVASGGVVDLVHLTPAKHAERVRRAGLAARSAGLAGGRGVYLMPVLSSFTLTHQWAREVRRWHPGPVMAVDVRVGDDELVWVGHYGEHPVAVTAAEAVGRIRSQRDPRGFEVFLPRAVGVGEIRRVRRIPQQVGWRYAPGSHGRRPCACPGCLSPGTYGAAAVRRRFPLDPPRRTKPELMAALRAAVSPQDIVDALWDLSGRSRGGAEELAYLAEHPDPQVRETLAEILRDYRGRAARDLRHRLAPGGPVPGACDR